MDILFWAAIILLALVVGVVIALACGTAYFYRLTILRKPTATLENNINANTNWYQHIDFISKRREWFDAQPMEEVYIKSYDGLKLHATLLKNKTESKKTVICFHGYTSCGKNDYPSLAKFYYEKGFNILIVDERAHGESEGKYIGFGVLDRYDAKSWVEYAVKVFGDDSIIFLQGDSMGGATILMAAGVDLPKNVKAIVADCAFTSAYDVFCHILKRDYHIPGSPMMNLTEFFTKRNAGYGYKDVSTLDTVSNTDIPILFIHGDKDDFVPVWMSEKNYEACKSDKELLIVEGADHAESYYVNPAAYEAAVSRFIDKYAN